MSDTQPRQDDLLTDQAEKVRTSFPELYAFLTDRQRQMRRVLVGIPDPADPECLVSSRVIDDAITQLRLDVASIGALLTGPATTGGGRP